MNRTVSAGEGECQRKISLDGFTHVSLPTSILLIVLLGFLEKRRRPKLRKCCGGRPALPVPVNLLVGDENQLSYIVAFGSTASNCVTLFTGDYIPPDTPSWQTIFFALGVVIEMGINYYPLFACLTMRAKLIGSFVGFIYSTIWFLINFVYVFECYDSQDDTKLIAIQFPVLLCLMFLMFKFLITFVTRLTQACIQCGVSVGILRESLRESNSFPDQKVAFPHQICRVRELLKGNASMLPKPPNSASIWGIFSYKWDETFRYSPRMKVTLAVIALSLYELGVSFLFAMNKLLDNAKSLLTINQLALGMLGGIHSTLDTFISTSTVCWYITFGLSSVVVVMYMIQLLLSYRSHVYRMYKGDYSFMPPVCASTHAVLMTQSLMYSGTQIAHCLWGYCILLLTIFVFNMVFAYLVVLPFMGLVSMEWTGFVTTILNTVLVSYVLYFMQVLVSSRLLLQKQYMFNGERNNKETVLALNNRRTYHICAFFLFFFNVFIGLWSCLLRILKGIVIGVLFLARIDRPALMRGFENWDRGFMTYVSFLHIEVAHTHPALSVFAQILIDMIEPHGTHHNTALPHDEDMERGNCIGLSTLGFPRRARGQMKHTRWLKAYTLLRNPSLVQYSKANLQQKNGPRNSTHPILERARKTHREYDLQMDNLQ